VDWRQLERWGLSEDQVSAGTEVAFRPPTIWERFRGVIVAVLVVIAAQTVLITLLLVERRRRIRAQRAAEDVREQLTHIGRVATLGELTAAISHELRQPLAAMRAQAEAGQRLLRRSPHEVAEAREIFADIISENVRAADVMDHIRTLMRRGATAVEAVDLNDLCRRAAALLQADADRRRVQLRTILHAEPPVVRGDAVQLQQVILNLAMNAMDAVQGADGAKEVVVGTASDPGGIELFVRDTGPGLQPEAQRRVFEPFFSTKTQGLGMGLAIVRSIVEQHHGRVRVENALGGGALFRVLFPVAPVLIPPAAAGTYT
jgi:C4-dicarboxylate-specific signal transduction histidine kinase